MVTPDKLKENFGRTANRRNGTVLRLVLLVVGTDGDLNEVSQPHRQTTTHASITQQREKSGNRVKQMLIHLVSLIHFGKIQDLNPLHSAKL